VRFAFLPAIYFMNFFLLSFGKAEKKISQTRELSADQIGAKITSPQIMANSLLKVHIYMHAWQQIKEKVNEALSTAEKKTVNVSSLLYSLCELIPKHFMKDEIGKSSSPHPIDSHPPLMARLDSMGMQLSTLYEEGLQLPKSDAAVELLENAQELEEAISLSLINQSK
jgi:Zn-dependent protease with chaperone function